MYTTNTLARWFSGLGTSVLAMGVAAGTAWIQSEEPAKGAEPAADSAADQTQQRIKDARDRAAAIGERAKEQGEGARETAHDVAKTARDKADGLRERAGKTIDAHVGARDRFRWQDYRPADMGIWFNHSVKDGLVISDVGSTGPIAKLGFREGDRIVSVNGKKVARPVEFIERLFADNVRDQRVEVVVMRGGTNETIYVEPAVLVDEYVRTEKDPLFEIGVILDDRHNDRVLVWKVLPRSPAFYAGVRKGDVVTTFHEQPVAAVAEFVQAIRDMEPDTVVQVEVNRGGKTRQLEIDTTRLAAIGERLEKFRQERSERREEVREERSDDRRDRREAREDEVDSERRENRDRDGILPRNR